MRGTMMNGRTMESTTWEMTRRASMPGRPTAMATTMEGTIAMRRVMILRMAG